MRDYYELYLSLSTKAQYDYTVCGFNKQKDIITVNVSPTLRVHSQKICGLKSKATLSVLLLLLRVIQEHCWHLQLRHLAAPNRIASVRNLNVKIPLEKEGHY